MAAAVSVGDCCAWLDLVLDRAVFFFGGWAIDSSGLVQALAVLLGGLLLLLDLALDLAGG